MANPYTLPTFTQQIDDFFVNTWYDIKAEAIDNITTATPIWAMLVEKGRLKNQNGSEIITETIDFALPVAEAVAKGHVFQSAITTTSTMAQWTWRNIGVNIQRDTLTDVANAGQYKIRDYAAERIKKARKAMAIKADTAIIASEVTDESGIEIQSIQDLIPTAANQSTGHYGNINRPSAFVYENGAGYGVKVGDPAGTNFWWGPKYLQMTAPYEVNFETDLTTLWNSVHNNQVPPDMILTTKRMIEIYEQFATDKTQLIKSESSMVVDLGYTVFRFKGADMTWSGLTPTDTTFLLTSDNCEIKYDSNLWFDMTEWKPMPNSLDRFAQILARCTFKGNEPRRFGRLYGAS